MLLSLFSFKVGEHIPTVPPAIARSLKYHATAKPWVDPWMVQQQKIRAARRAKKLAKKANEKKSKSKTTTSTTTEPTEIDDDSASVAAE